MSNLTTLRAATRISAPSPIERKLGDLVSVSINGLREEFGDLTIYADRAPNPAGRQALEARAEDVRHGLTPASEIEIRKAYGQVLAVLVPRNVDGIDAEAARRGVFAVLGDLPAWAIEQACSVYLLGDAGDKHFAPTATEIRQAAKRRMQRHEDELAKIEKILAARVVPAPKW